MYSNKNIGKTIKIASFVLLVINVAASIGFGIYALNNYLVFWDFRDFLVFGLIPAVLSLVLSFFGYGFGVLVENSCKLAEREEAGRGPKVNKDYRKAKPASKKQKPVREAKPRPEPKAAEQNVFDADPFLETGEDPFKESEPDLFGSDSATDDFNA